MKNKKGEYIIAGDLIIVFAPIATVLAVAMGVMFVVMCYSDIDSSKHLVSTTISAVLFIVLICYFPMQIAIARWYWRRFRSEKD